MNGTEALSVNNVKFRGETLDYPYSFSVDGQDRTLKHDQTMENTEKVCISDWSHSRMPAAKSSTGVLDPPLKSRL